MELIGPRGTTGPVALPKVRKSLSAGRAAGKRSSSMAAKPPPVFLVT